MADPSYRAAPAEALRVERLGEVIAIFDRRSMQTHLVVSPLPEILAAMGSEACNAALLSARLAASFELADGEETRALLKERLRELAGLGLVEAE